MRSFAPRLAQHAAAACAAAAAVFAACAFVACTEDEGATPATKPTTREDQSNDVDAGGETDASTADASQPKQYLAFLEAGPCGDVSGATRAAGTRGRWVSQPLFPDAPPAVREIACAYSWTPTRAPTRDSDTPDVLDRDALFAGLGEADLVTPSATPIPIALPAIDPREAEPIDGGFSGDGPPTGVSGCDVCGRVAAQRIFVIRPPEKVSHHRLLVPTTTGMFRVFDVPATTSAQVFTVQLPTTPSGDAYTEGRAILVPSP